MRATVELIDYFRRHAIPLRADTVFPDDGMAHPVEGEDGRIHSVMIGRYPPLGVRLILCPEGGVPPHDDLYFQIEPPHKPPADRDSWIPASLKARAREVSSRWKARRGSRSRAMLYAV